MIIIMIFIYLYFFYFKICTRCHLKQKEEEISTEKALTAICEAKFGLGNNYLFYYHYYYYTLILYYTLDTKLY